ncbi:PREDICTED: chromatin modification-related protein EAF7-like [Ipomoea nil]|uniref:chromatin modification-related protein EAF7-like n=1 Tax=Ipomoea nil TaxID=35883 RepID=UPI000900866C|nr:PREDICTED: chromatin modification-related protein EAF7-like [Ipomoea nil]
MRLSNIKTELEKLHQNDPNYSTSAMKDDKPSDNIPEANTNKTRERKQEEEKDDEIGEDKEDEERGDDSTQDNDDDDESDESSDDANDPDNEGVVAIWNTGVETERNSQSHNGHPETSPSAQNNPLNEMHDSSSRSTNDGKMDASPSVRHDNSNPKDRGAQTSYAIEISQPEARVIVSFLKQQCEQSRLSCEWLQSKQKSDNTKLDVLSRNMDQVLERLSTLQPSQDTPGLSQQIQTMKTKEKQKEILTANKAKANKMK